MDDYFSSILVNSNQMEHEIRELLHELGYSGTHSIDEEINHIYKAIYDYCLDEIQDLLPKLVSVDLTAFFLAQRAQYINQPFFKSKPIVELALEWLIEEMTKMIQFAFHSRQQDFDKVSRLLALTKCMIIASHHSDTIHSLHPGMYSIDLSNYIDGIPQLIPESRLSVSLNQFYRFLTSPADGYSDFLEPTPVDEIQHSIDTVFKSSFGCSLSNAFAIALTMSHSCQEMRGIPGVYFCEFNGTLNAVSGNTGISFDTVKDVLAELVLTAEDPAHTQRVVYKPLQSWRLLRRPFIKFEFEGTTQLIWSKDLVTRSVLYLLQEIGFGRVPVGWSTVEVVSASKSLSQFHDNGWEKTVFGEFIKRGFIGQLRVKKIRLKTKTIKPPGEIDALLWSDELNSIIVLECKRTQPSYTSYDFRYDLDNFTRGTKAYIIKLGQKVDWVYQHKQDVLEFLTKENAFTTHNPADVSIRTAIITKHPCYAMTDSPKYNILPLNEVLAYYDREHKWMLSSV